MSRELENASSERTRIDESGNSVLTEALDAPDERNAQTPSDSSDFINVGSINRAALDPFAGDIFAKRISSLRAGELEDADASRAEAQQNSNRWFSGLPKVSREDAQRSDQLERFPDRFAARETLTNVLARLLHETEGRIEFRLIERREFSPDESKENAFKMVSSGAATRMWANISLEPEDAALCIALNQAFAIELIGRMVGDFDVNRQANENGTTEGKPRAELNLRELSKIESAIYEFLWINIISELNRAADEPALRLHGIARQAPAWLTANRDAHNRTADLTDNQSENGASASIPRGALLTFRIALGETFGLARCYLSDTLLAAFANNRHPFLIEHTRTNEKLKSYASLVTHAESSIQIGTTTVTPAEINALETGDVLKLERSFVEWRAVEADAGSSSVLIAGNLHARIGAGRNFVIKGYALNQTAQMGTHYGMTEARDAANISLVIETISGGQSAPEAQRMNNVSIDETTERAAQQNTGYGEDDDERYSARNMTGDAERVSDVMNESDGSDGMNNEVANDSAGNVLDELLMTVHVELAARRMSLEELSRLRPGQVIDLGCRATDPVDLLVDARRIARGELVEIEGGLGVRVTSVNG